MSLLLYVLAVVLIAAAVALRGREGSRNLQAGLAVAALAAVALALLSRPGSQQETLQGYEEVAGYLLGELAMEAADGKGPVLVLRSATDPDSDEPTAIRFRGLLKACGGRTLIEAGPDPSGVGPPSDEHLILDGDTWYTQVAEWARQHPDAVAVVSLLFEFPDVSDSWSADLPPLYGFTAGPSQAWIGAMRDGWLKAAVRYRPRSQPHADPPRTASREEIFDLRFEWVTPENVREVLGSQR